MTIRRLVRGAIAGAAAAVGLACSGGNRPVDPTQPAAVVTGSNRVSYRAETFVLKSFPVQLSTVVTATNVGDQPVRLESDGCEAFLLAYRRPDRSGPPAWDQRQVIGCTRILKWWDLAPGDSVQLRAYTRAQDILGDSLPNGQYYLSAVPHTDQSLAVPAGDVRLDLPGKP